MRWQERSCAICGRMNGQHTLYELAVCEEEVLRRELAPNGLTFSEREEDHAQEYD